MRFTHHRLLLSLIVIYSFLSSTGLANTIEKHLDWPPVFEGLIGNPEITIKHREPGREKVQWVRPLKVVNIFVADACQDRARSMLTDYVLEKVWNEYLSENSLSAIERKFEMKEIIPISRSDFFHIGRIRLSGKKTGSKVRDAWWDVRMGCPLTESTDHLLCFNNLAWAEKNGISHGHFSFAVRRRGGDPDGDMIFDFRAPWSLERRSGVKDMFNDSMYLESFHENYYDWLSTQTALRHCDIYATFVPVSREQLVLLNAYEGGIHRVNKYRLFKGNCASLGLQFINRITRLDQRIKNELSIMDYPERKIEFAAEVFGDVIAEVDVFSSTVRKGRELTHKNVTRTAGPSRETCDAFQKLLGVASIN